MRKLLALALIALLLSACGTAAIQVASAGQDDRAPAVAEATEAPAAPEATEAATAEPEATEASSAGGDAARGAVLFAEVRQPAGVACSGCHRADSDARLVGPGLATVGLRAETRRGGMSAGDYLHESIVAPGAFVVAGYFNMMPGSFGAAFSGEELDDLVAYLLTLRG